MLLDWVGRVYTLSCGRIGCWLVFLGILTRRRGRALGALALRVAYFFWLVCSAYLFGRWLGRCLGRCRGRWFGK